MSFDPIVPGAIAVGLLLAAAVSGQVARRRLERANPPTGRLVDVGGFRLHLVERGSGPTVVLEGGTWAPGLVWGPVGDELARFARVVTYDRAGLGWSDPSPLPRTPAAMAEELHELLRRTGIPGPYVLVGHSFGGVVVRVFAARWPAEVAGLVLLDAAHEAQLERFPEPVRRMFERMSTAMPLMFGALRALVAAGVVALRPSLVPSPSGGLPADTVARIRATIAARPSVARTMAREMRDLPAGYAEVRAMGLASLGDLPLSVVSHGRPEGVPPQLGPAVAAAYEETWQALQAEQAALSIRGRRTVADGIGHDIPGEAPGLVVEAVRDVLGAAGSRVAA